MFRHDKVSENIKYLVILNIYVNRVKFTSRFATKSPVKAILWKKFTGGTNTQLHMNSGTILGFMNGIEENSFSWFSLLIIQKKNLFISKRTIFQSAIYGEGHLTVHKLGFCSLW